MIGLLDGIGKVLKINVTFPEFRKANLYFGQEATDESLHRDDKRRASKGAGGT